MIEIVCKECRKTCLARRSTKRFCSDRCGYNNYIKRYGRKSRVVPKKLPCTYCKKIFDYSHNKLRKFCSRKCGINFRKEEFYAYNNKRRRNLKITHPWRMPVEAAKNRAAIKGITCNLTEAWAIKVWTGYCAISGLAFKYERSSKGPSIFAPSIDRIDSTKGYAQDNCRFVLACVNFFKNNGTDAEMFKIAEAIATRQLPRSIDSILSLPA